MFKSRASQTSVDKRSLRNPVKCRCWFFRSGAWGSVRESEFLTGSQIVQTPGSMQDTLSNKTDISELMHVDIDYFSFPCLFQILSIIHLFDCPYTHLLSLPWPFYTDIQARSVWASSALNKVWIPSGSYKRGYKRERKEHNTLRCPFRKAFLPCILWTLKI